MARTPYDGTNRSGAPQSRNSTAWIALVAVIAGVVGYFLFFTGEPDDGTLTGAAPGQVAGDRPATNPAAPVPGPTAAN